MNNFVTTKKAWGPRGDYFNWCKLLDNGTLEFGEEQGNYAGGTTLSYRWYNHPQSILPEYTPITEEYWDSVRKTLSYWKKENNSFYQSIIMMCIEHEVEIPGVEETKTPRFNVGDIVQHFKRETISPEEQATNMYLYKIIAKAEHTETKESLVIYQALYPPFNTYARPISMFTSKVDKEKYPKIKQEYRLQPITSLYVQEARTWVRIGQPKI